MIPMIPMCVPCHNEYSVDFRLVGHSGSLCPTSNRISPGQQGLPKNILSKHSVQARSSQKHFEHAQGNKVFPKTF